MTPETVPEPWDGARNLADLGGLPLVDGTATRRGVAWRSAAPEWLTEDGWRAARAAGITRVVDLRNDIERGRRAEHPVVAADAMSGIEVVHAPTEDPDDAAFLAECGPWLDHPRSWAPNLARYPEKLAHVFDAVADADGAVLIRCVGGRDRTGMVCSMLLSLAGATPRAIADSYERGFRGAAEHDGHGMAYDADAGEWVHAQPDRTRSAGDLDLAVADRIPVLLEWVRTTDVADYLLGAGVPASRLERVRERIAHRAPGSRSRRRPRV